jgi:formate dehydrogenase accessory protein FdhE
VATPKQDDSTPGLDEIAARLERLTGQPHVSEEYVRFRIDLLKAQWAVRQALAGALFTGHRTEAAGAMAAGPGGMESTPPGPALTPDAVPWDPRMLDSLFAAICQSAARHGRQTEDIQRLVAAVEGDPALLEVLARSAGFGPDMDTLESMARQARVFVDALLFVGRALAAPFVAEAAWRLSAARGGMPGGTDTHGRCRMCGSPPAIARLRREDGRRVLSCGLCGASWEYVRLACPTCENRDRETLTLLRASETDARWVEACERCMSYIKTVDERKLPLGETIIPVVEETATLHLDLLAEKEGYIRRLPYAMSG